MKIRIVEKDYVDYLFKFYNTKYLKDKLIYPFKNPGFNMSISKFYNNKFIICIRNVIPFSVILTLTKKTLKNPIIQGILPRKIPENNLFKEVYNNRNYSQKTIWDWFNTYESTIFFVCDIDENKLKLIVDKNVEPFVLYRPQYFFPIEKILNNSLRPSQHYYPQEDFRLYFENNICYTFDSFVNQIKIITFENSKLNIINKYNHVCNYRFTNNNIIKQNEYKKVFEKNWTLYNIIYNKNNKEKYFQFIHDFEKDGLYGVDFNTLTNKCYKKLLVSYPKNTIPIHKNNDYCRFSIGSTALKYNKDEYLAIGHIKINLKTIKKDKLKIFTTKKDKKIQKIYNNHFHKIALKIHRLLKNKYDKKYRPHHQYIYGIFLFIYNQNDKTLKISNIYFPEPKYKFYFSLSFPMSIININNKYIISSGYGDYTNILISLEKDELDKIIKYDLKNIDITKIKFEFI